MPRGGLHARRAHRREALHANRAMKGTDHAFSLEPVGLRKMVRDLERTCMALGDGARRSTRARRRPSSRWARASWWPATCRAGHVLTAADIVMKSPGGGIPPYELDKVIGRVTLKALHAGRLPLVRGPGQAETPSSRVRERTLQSRRQVAVVTGALGKLGPVWVEALLEAGARVAALDLPGAPASPAFRALAASAPGSRLLRFDCDITERESIEAAAAAVVERHAASRPCSSTTPASTSRPTVRRQSHRDRRPAHRSVPPHVRGEPARHVPGDAGLRRADGGAAAGGSIINIGSLYASVSPDQRFYDHLAGNAPFLKPPAYGASKAGVVNLTKYLRDALGRARVSREHAVAGRRAGGPGRAVQGEVRRRACRCGRMAEAEDLKGPLVFLASRPRPT